MKKIIKIILSVLLIFSFAAAYANSAPVYMKAYPSSDMLAVDKNSTIEVKNENLVFDFSNEEDYLYSYKCKVTAEYEMVNPTAEDLSVKMAFPFIESIGALSDGNIKITAGNELSYDVYLGEITNKYDDSGDAEEKNYFEFEKIIETITNDIYKADNFADNEAGKLYSIEFKPSSDAEIRVAADLDFDYGKTKILAGNFSGFSREGGKTRLTTWCREPEVMEIYVLGEDADFSISGYTDGSLNEETDLYTYEISEKEIDVKTYLLQSIRNYPYINFDNISDIQLYNLFAKIMDEQFTNNSGLCTLDELLSYGGISRLILLVYDVEFPKNSEKTVSVSYKTAGTMDRRSTREPLHIYDYILNPAENWRDFKNLNIKIIPPEEAPYVIKSSIELNKEGNIYTAFLESLPEEDFTFTVYHKDKITFMDDLLLAIDRVSKFIFMFSPFILVLILIFAIVVIFSKKKNA